MTFTWFVNGLENALSALARVHSSGPPASVNSADLPMAWVEVPTGDSASIAFTGGQWITYHADVVLVYQPAAQSTAEQAYATGLGWMDALADVLYSANVCISRLRFDVKLAITTVAGTDYWSVRAKVEGGDKYG